MDRPAGPSWQMWVDTGGTFTDCLACDPQGEMHRAKVLSDSSVRVRIEEVVAADRLRLGAAWEIPDDFLTGCEMRRLDGKGDSTRVVGWNASDRLLLLAGQPEIELAAGTGLEIRCGVEAPILAAHWLTKTPLDGELPALKMRLATTRGTNALLERRGARTALFVTHGHGDLLRIGNQQRPELFSLEISPPNPLYETVIEVDERLNARGEVLTPIDLGDLQERAEDLVAAGIEVAAVALMHSYRNPVHEDLLADFLLNLGFRHVSCSAALAPLIKIVPRARTAVINAYLSDVIAEYLERVERAVGDGSLHVMTSAGGMISSAEYPPKDSLLSGPAGGVVGATFAALRSGFERSLAFDMGGTSTDVSRYDGDFDYLFETRVGDAELMAPSLAIETVAAGGGSVCEFDGRQLKVGPHSAGAVPGPACYGAGGPLTLTDVNLLLGRLDPDAFEIPIDREASARAAQDLFAEVDRQLALEAPEVLLQGFLDIANERMAEAVRRISIRRGYKPGDYTLVAFGGAGGQHAIALAEILGIGSVLVPEDAGLLSAVGLSRARIERIVERQVLQPLKSFEGDLGALLLDLEEEAVAAVSTEGVTAIEIRHRLIMLRLEGQEFALGVSFVPGMDLRVAFFESYLDHYGYSPQQPTIEVESVRVIASSIQTDPQNLSAIIEPVIAVPASSRPVWLSGEWRQVPIFLRADLRPGDYFSGPCLIFEAHCATLLDEPWHGQVDAVGCLVIGRADEEKR